MELRALICVAGLACSDVRAEAAHVPGDGAPAGYVVYQTVAVDSAQAGLRGALRILQDKRVTRAYRQSWGVSADPTAALGDADPLVLSVKDHPLRNGSVQLVAADNRVIDQEILGEPLARIETTFLYGTAVPTYPVAVDYGIGMGSYAGPATLPVEIRGGRLVHVQATDETGKVRDLMLWRTLKSDWRIVPAPGGKGKQIETITCRPHIERPTLGKTAEFVVVMTRYRMIGGRWHGASRETAGFWENEGRMARFPGDAVTSIGS